MGVGSWKEDGARQFVLLGLDIFFVCGITYYNNGLMVRRRDVLSFALSSFVSKRNNTHFISHNITHNTNLYYSYLYVYLY